VQPLELGDAVDQLPLLLLIARDDYKKVWLPFVDAYRTLCVAPTAFTRGVLEGVAHIRFPAARESKRPPRSIGDDRLRAPGEIGPL
jgi:hypothetical protein